MCSWPLRAVRERHRGPDKLLLPRVGKGLREHPRRASLALFGVTAAQRERERFLCNTHSPSECDDIDAPLSLPAAFVISRPLRPNNNKIGSGGVWTSEKGYFRTQKHYSSESVSYLWPISRHIHFLAFISLGELFLEVKIALLCKDFLRYWKK